MCVTRVIECLFGHTPHPPCVRPASRNDRFDIGNTIPPASDAPRPPWSHPPRGHRNQSERLSGVPQ